MSCEKLVKLLMEHNLRIDSENLPDNVKCMKCKAVMKDACQVPCGCTFCRICIHDLIASGDKFCPGVSEDCDESPLSHFLTDYKANKIISRLMVKCPLNECLYRCQLIEMDDHIQICAKKSVECPFRELGCRQNKLTTEAMNEHLCDEIRSHCEILIPIIVNVNKVMESNKREIEMLKYELLLKDNQIKTIIDENKSIKDEIKSIKVQTEMTTKQMDTSCEWIIDEDVEMTGWGGRTSNYFTGAVHPYKYQLESANGGITGGSLWIWLYIHPGASDSKLPWPFRDAVTVTVTDKIKREACRSITLQCEMRRPSNGECVCSSTFIFPYSSLNGAGLDLRQGVLVSCMIGSSGVNK